MDTPKLARRCRADAPVAAIASAAAVVVVLTAAGFLVGLLVPALAGRTSPHPALAGRFTDAVWILASNLRVLVVPFVLVWLQFGRTHAGRLVGDLLVLALAAASTVTVGLELGRWQSRLIPFVPQLPIEWAALAIALATWLLARNNRTTSWRQLVAMAVVAAALLVLAAGVETWCTPHRPQIQTADRTLADAYAVRPSSRVTAVVFRFGLCAAPRPGRCKVAGSLPLTCVRFRSTWAALTVLTTTTDPQ